MTTLAEEVGRLRNLDIDDLVVLNKAVVKLIKEKRTQNDMAKAATLTPGMNVRFSYNKIDYEGTITKVNVKSCQVNVTAPPHKIGSVKVHISMLEVV